MMVIDISQTGLDPVDLAAYLLDEKNIFVREGNYTSKLFGDRYIRVSYSIPTEEIMVFRNEFKDAVETLQKRQNIIPK